MTKNALPATLSPVYDQGDGTFAASTPVGNQSPTVANIIPNQVATEDSVFTFQFNSNTFSDPDGDILTYTAALSSGSALPSWLTFTAATRTFSGTPLAANVGTITVRVTASDGEFSVYDDFDIVIGEAGADPELAFSTYSSLAAFDSDGTAWTEESDGTGNFMRCTYAGEQTAPYQLSKNLTGSPSEYWIALDQRQSITNGSCKFMKFFGFNNGNGLTSNNTWNNGYTGALDGVMYGNTNGASNDATCVIKYVNTSFDTRSSADWNIIFRKLEALNLSSTWRRFKFHWKQHDSGVCNTSGTTVTRTSGKNFASTVAGMQITINNVEYTIQSVTSNDVLELTGSAGTQTGVAFGVQNAIVEVFVDDVLWLHATRFYNHADQSSGFARFTIGDYTQVAGTWTFDVRNVKLSYVGMPT